MNTIHLGIMPLLLTSMLSLAACDSDDGSSQAPDAALPDAAPECGTTDTYTVYLNRNGGDYKPGPTNPGTNESPIVTGPVTLQPYGADDAVWNAAVACVQEDFAPFRILVTDMAPDASAAHMEVAVIGEDESSIGAAMGSNSIAPSGCQPVLGIAFVFGDTFAAEEQTLCKQMEWTIAKMFAIDNHVGCGDISSWDLLGECAAVDAEVVDAPLGCGEFEARPCQCGNSSTSNSYAALAEHAGLTCQ